MPSINRNNRGQQQPGPKLSRPLRRVGANVQQLVRSWARNDETAQRGWPGAGVFVITALSTCDKGSPCARRPFFWMRCGAVLRARRETPALAPPAAGGCEPHLRLGRRDALTKVELKAARFVALIRPIALLYVVAVQWH